MLNWAVEEGLIPKNPITDVYLRQREEDGQRGERPGEWFTEDQMAKMERFLANNDPEMGQSFVFMCNTGLRVSELLSLEWSQVDIEKRRIFIPAEKNKTNTNRYVPLNPKAMAVIEHLYLKKPYAPHVFRHLHVNTFIRKFGRYTERALEIRSHRTPAGGPSPR